MSHRRGPFERRGAASLVFGLFVAGGLVLVFTGTLARSTNLEAQAQVARQEIAALESRVAAGKAEVEFVKGDPFIEQYARAVGYGKRNETIFELQEDAPPPPPITPIGSSPRAGAPAAPFDAWMALLFGA
jgi:cell division protein FtsB